MLLFLFIISLMVKANFRDGTALFSVENPCQIMTPRGGDGDWGEGAYILPQRFDVILYEKPGGNIFGVLRKSNASVRLHSENGKPMLAAKGLEWIGHDSKTLLKVKKSKDNRYMTVFWKSFPKGLNLKKKDAEMAGLQFFTYQQLLNHKLLPDKIRRYAASVRIGVNLQKNCLILRQQPSKISKRIGCIPGNDWNVKTISHLEILETQGQWAKVEVVKEVYDESMDESGEDCSFIEQNRQSGWLKSVDQSGFPNIWYSLSGY